MPFARLRELPNKVTESGKQVGDYARMIVGLLMVIALTLMTIAGAVLSGVR